ncbi:carboxylesterase/lipase family protein [Salinisphaera sp.]|uniref:carboxylesterase/lipase family protein n=1 Tax=Salinisphaera sp. TaxID=1914330 RepID=UPI002D76C15D|nr:carboxylesterase/lipase family protein [Salinisphaera sp.]HET7315561.1 carboxylesterase/lipase family protein [Salinisphaera sp.]
MQPKKVVDLASLAVLAVLVVTALSACDDDDIDLSDSSTGDVQKTKIIQTENGPVQGKISQGMREFLGIRYAAPPVGNLRWRPPQAPDEWTEVKEATQYEARCSAGKTIDLFGTTSTDEDCLFLNVFAPQNTSATAELPVMVWIHGGGLKDGSANDYNPVKLVRQGDVIVVTINYRTNVFGFLALPGLDSEGHKFANYGIMDQQFALKWVKSNISKFGGDPDNVTIFGESAGGLSVLANLISPTAEGLFDRAIVESGSYTSLSTPQSLASAEERGQAFAKAVNCQSSAPSQTVACLRALSVEEIQSEGSQYVQSNASLTLDGVVLTKTQRQAFESGDFNQVPVIIGTNKDEYRNFIGLEEYGTGKVVNDAEYEARIKQSYGAVASKVLAQYPVEDYPRADVALAAPATDSVFVCPALRKAELLKEKVPTYYYEFADRTAPVYQHAAPIPYGAYHSGEIQYLFKGFNGARGRKVSLNDAQKMLSSVMIDYWTQFARNGNPNGDATPQWPLFSKNQFMSLNIPKSEAMSLSSLRQEHHCDFWDSIQE